MEDRFLVIFPFGGARLELDVEPEVSGTFVQDCEVWCNPWRIRVVVEGDERRVDVERENSSE